MTETVEARSISQRPISYVRPSLPARRASPRFWFTWLLILALRTCAPLPLRFSRALGAALGLAMYVFNGKRRRIARANLRLCFPEESIAWRRRTLRRHFIVNGQAYVDLGLLAWGKEQRVIAAVRFIGLDHLERALDAGRAVILLAPHCVGMNFGGAVLARQRGEFSMFKPQRNALVDWLLNQGRTRFGCKLLARAQGLRPVLRALASGLPFYYLPDEDFGPRRSVFAPFFGVPRATLPNLGRLATSARAVVLPCVTRVLPGARGYEVVLSAPLAGLTGGDAQGDAALMNAAIESAVRAAPEQYMWTLRFFRTRPDGGAPPYRRAPRRRPRARARA